MIKLSYQNFGANWRVRIQGENQQEIEETFNSIYNRDGANGELELDGNDGYFWTTPKNLKIGFINIELTKILNKLDDCYNRYKDKRVQLTDENTPAFRELAIKRADKRFIEMESEVFPKSKMHYNPLSCHVEIDG